MAKGRHLIHSSMSRLLATRRQASTLALKCAVGAVVATPLVAICQASFFLLNYRINYADAPRPECPSRGAILVQSRQELARSTQRSLPKEIAVVKSSERPIRLLVIGDSLAMGVGCSAPVPVLPVSIAKSLSKHLGGTIVDWTCHGKPGLSAAQLVKEIELFRQQEAERIMEQEMQCKEDAGEVVLVHGEMTAGESNETVWKRWKALLPRQRNPKLYGEYDAVVIIIGMGDLKAKALPFMKMETEENHGEQPSRGFEHDLENIRDLFVRNEESGSGNKKQPLVVFPALPARTVTIFQYPPLRWFVVPLMEMLDQEKWDVASTSSGSVLFVEEPSTEVIMEFEDGTGSLKEMLDKEDVAFEIRDTAGRPEGDFEKIEKGIPPSAIDAEVRNGQSNNKPVVSKRLFNRRPPPAASFNAPDKIHPNNIGYDFWGRHIAYAMLHEMRKD